MKSLELIKNTSIEVLKAVRLKIGEIIVTGNKIMLMAAMLFFTMCASCSEQPDNTALPAEFFNPTEGVKKIFIVGSVEHVGISDYEKLKCPSDKIFLHLATWQVYEVEGYILPESEETEINLFK